MPFPIIINKRKKETEKNMSTRLLELGNRLRTHTYSWRDLDASTVG
jgi:hypothetical protein